MSVVHGLPLIRLPEAWPLPVVAGLAMAALAALDLVGAVAAKEWALHRSAVPLVVGAATFLLLFWVYASSLQYAELALVTLGWIVVLQAGLLAVDRIRYGVDLLPGQWVAVTIIVAAEAYLILGAGRA